MLTLIKLYMLYLFMKFIIKLFLTKTSLGRLYLVSNERRSLQFHKSKMKKYLLQNLKEMNKHIWRQCQLIRTFMGENNLKDIFTNNNSKNNKSINYDNTIKSNIIILEKYKKVN